MLGKVRVSSSSLESLEQEREEPVKVTKHDSLSIYEATLAKLRQGAQLELTSITEQEKNLDMDFDSSIDQPNEKIMMIDTHPSPCSVLPNTSECWLLSGSSKESRNKTMTVISMFDKYKISHCAMRTPYKTDRD